MEEEASRRAGTVLNGHEKRFIVWTCATAKYNLRLLMMRSDHPTWETGALGSLQFLLKLSHPPHPSCGTKAGGFPMAGWRRCADFTGKASTWCQGGGDGRPFYFSPLDICPPPLCPSLLCRSVENWEWMGPIRFFNKWIITFSGTLYHAPQHIRNQFQFSLSPHHIAVSQRKLKVATTV